MTMTPSRIARARIRSAQAEIDATRRAFEQDLARWRGIVRRHRTACIVAGGFAGGVLLGCVPVRAWARIGAGIAGGAALIARSLLTPVIAGAIAARQQRRDVDALYDADSGAIH